MNITLSFNNQKTHAELRREAFYLHKELCAEMSISDSLRAWELLTTRGEEKLIYGAFIDALSEFGDNALIK